MQIADNFDAYQMMVRSYAFFRCVWHRYARSVYFHFFFGSVLFAFIIQNENKKSTFRFMIDVLISDELSRKIGSEDFVWPSEPISGLLQVFVLQYSLKLIKLCNQLIVFKN